MKFLSSSHRTMMSANVNFSCLIVGLVSTTVTTNKELVAQKAGGTNSGQAFSRASDPLPQREVPNGFNELRDVRGSGRALFGTFQGDARSAMSVLRGMLGGPFRQYFDDRPQISAAASSPDDQRVIAPFRATMGAVPVAGWAAVELERGKGGITLIFDHPETLNDSLQRVLAALRAIKPSRGGAPQGVPMTPCSNADGSARARIPRGWRCTAGTNGALQGEGPEGQQFIFGVPQPVGLYPMLGSNIPVAPFTDPVTATRQLNDPRVNPNSPIQQLQVIESLPVPDPNPGRKSAFIYSSMLYQGQPYLSFAFVQIYPVSSSEWIYHYSTLAAPTGIFNRDFGLLIQTYASWAPDPALFRQRIEDAMSSMRQAGEIYRSATRSGPNYAGINEAWDRRMKGLDTVEHVATGTQFTIALKSSDRFCREMGPEYRCVPASQTKP